MMAEKTDRKAAKTTTKAETKATPADYKAPVDRSMKGPSGEQVMTAHAVANITSTKTATRRT